MCVRACVDCVLTLPSFPPASHQSRTPEHPHQSQHRAQQGMSDQHLQVQVLPRHQRPHHHPQKCQQHGERFHPGHVGLHGYRPNVNQDNKICPCGLNQELVQSRIG